MKIWPRLIGVIFILALFCSPVLAISQSDLISQLRSQGAGTGTLSVTSSPVGAEVYLDGVYKGTTAGELKPFTIHDGWIWGSNHTSTGLLFIHQPVTITGIPIGSHNLRVTLSGYEDYSSWVIITNDKEVHVKLKVQSGSTTIPITVPTTIPTTVPTTVPTGQLPSYVKTGSVSVSSTPPGARVFLDGVDRGTTPVTITGVPFGLHNLRVTLSGYGDYSTRFFLVSGKTVSVTLERIPIIFDPKNTIDAKPNIYLYSDRDLTARVRLFPEYAITASDPPYRPGIGWIAEIRNGSLNGAGDFLFYEALGHDSGWQKQEGYIIRGAYREQDMASMLGEYGFNEKETAEFIEYWACHLAGDSDYVFYPQETDAVNRNMPLSITPEPDAVTRIKFLAEPLVSAPEPVTDPEQIVREGFYVVEWGVTIREEFLDT
ncbi:MAG: PEGA domain-containing protein [Methanomicrobiales archaeon]|nr:PEGA domain-containing protein [Methanomicrobiales archaeon]